MNKAAKKALDEYLVVLRRQCPTGWVLSPVTINNEIDLMLVLRTASVSQRYKRDLDRVITRLAEYRDECLVYLRSDEPLELKETK